MGFSIINYPDYPAVGVSPWLWNPTVKHGDVIGQQEEWQANRLADKKMATIQQEVGYGSSFLVIESDRHKLDTVIYVILIYFLYHIRFLNLWCQAPLCYVVGDWHQNCGARGAPPQQQPHGHGGSPIAGWFMSNGKSYWHRWLGGTLMT